jgi:hypothetical protein
MLIPNHPALLFVPEKCLAWTNKSGTIGYIGWQSATDVFDMKSHWYESENGLFAFTGHLWPSGGGWQIGTSWAKSLAAFLESHSPLDFGEKFHGLYSVVCLPENGTGCVITDPFSAALVYWAENREVVAISSRASLAAHAVSLKKKPNRDAGNIGWLTYFTFIVGEETSFKRVKVLPPDTCFRIKVNGQCSIERTRSYGCLGHRHATAPRSQQKIDEIYDDLVGNIDSIATLSVSGRVSQLSGGKDSRLIASLILATGRQDDFQFNTFGLENNPDIIVAKQLADKFGLNLKWNKPVAAQLTAEQFESRLRAHVFQTDGMFGAWDLKGGTAITRSITLSGLYGELMRSQYAPRHKVSNEAELRNFFDHNMHFNAGGYVRRECAEYYIGWIQQWITEQLQQGILPENVPDLFYMRFRLRRWFGTAQEVNGMNPTAFPLETWRGVRSAFQMGHRARQIDLLHFELMRRANIFLTKLPFANDTWHSDLFSHLEDADDYRTVDPIQLQKKPGEKRPFVSWQEANWEANKVVFEEYLLQDKTNPIFEIVDFMKVQNALIQKSPPALHYLFAILGGAIWLGEKEQKIQFSSSSPVKLTDSRKQNIRRIVNDPDGYQRACRNLAKVQIRHVDEMARDYERLYSQLLSTRDRSRAIEGIRAQDMLRAQKTALQASKGQLWQGHNSKNMRRSPPLKARRRRTWRNVYSYSMLHIIKPTVKRHNLTHRFGLWVREVYRRNFKRPE